MYAFVDTETTGLPCGGEQPRIVSIAWIVAERLETPRAVRGAIVRPEGFTIPDAATAIHGITTGRALQEGRPLAAVLAEFAEDLAGFGVRWVVAHNLADDRPVIEAEYGRLGQASPLAALEGICTMRAARRCWPGERAGLGAVHARLFGQGVEDAHSAEADVMACCRIFFALDPASVVVEPVFDGAVLEADRARIAQVQDWAAGEPGFDRREFVDSLGAWVGRGRMLTAKQRMALARVVERWSVPGG